MPRKKVSKKKDTANKFDIQKLIKSSDSYKSLIYGIITVVVLSVVIFLGVNTLSKNKAEITETAASTQQDLKKATYVVREGETLWSIAETKYGDGFKWELIANANKITDPTTLEKGTKLVIPEIAKEAVTPSKVPTTTPVVNDIQSDKKIASNSYTVVRNDSLWEIAVRAYGDGYRWVEIAKVNNLANPDLIFSGNVLKLPRP
jgi:putative chitinase